MLALAEVEEGHHGCFFVLRGVAFEDFGDELLVDGVELEGDGGVVFGAVAVLETGSVRVRGTLRRAMDGRGTYDLESFACHARCGG